MFTIVFIIIYMFTIICLLLFVYNYFFTLICLHLLVYTYLFTIICLHIGMEDTLEEDQKEDLDDSECVEEINGDRSILAQAYRVIDEAGPEGLSAIQLGII